MDNVTPDGLKNMENPLDRYQRTAIHYILVSVLLVLEKDDLINARNLIRQLVNPPFRDIGDLVDMVQRNFLGGSNSCIISGEAVNYVSQDCHKIGNSKVQETAKSQSETSISSLFSLKSIKRTHQSKKNNEKGFKFSGLKKPKVPPNSESHRIEDSDDSDSSLCQESCELFEKRKVSSSKPKHTHYHQSMERTFEANRIDMSLQCREAPKTHENCLPVEDGTQKPSKVKSHDTDQTMRAAQEGQSHSSHQLLTQKRIQPKLDESDSFGESSENDGPEKSAKEASEVPKSRETTPIIENLKIGSKEKEQTSKKPSPRSHIKNGDTAKAEFSRTVKTKSKKTGIQDSEPSVSMQEQNKKNLTEAQTKIIMKTQDEATTKSSVAPRKTYKVQSFSSKDSDMELNQNLVKPVVLHANSSDEVKESDATSSSSSSESDVVETGIKVNQLYSKPDVVQPNIMPSPSKKSSEVLDKNSKYTENNDESKSGSSFQKTRLRINNDSKQSKDSSSTSRKSESVLFVSSTESEPDSDTHKIKTEKDAENTSEKIKQSTKIREKESVAKDPVSIGKKKSLFSRIDTGNRTPCSISRDLIEVEQEYELSMSQQSKIHKSSTSDLEKSSKKTKINVLTSDDHNTSLVGTSVEHKKSVDNSFKHDLEKGNKPTLRRINRDVNQLPEEFKTNQFRPTGNNASLISVSQDSTNLQNKFLRRDRNNRRMPFVTSMNNSPRFNRSNDKK